jgi:phosphatidylinositol 4-phosphatase
LFIYILADITRSLQHKQDQVVKSREHHTLLADLNVFPFPESAEFDKEASVEGRKINPLSEPNPTLPLWRRVDKRFWWNEWLSKAFIDAGVIILTNCTRRFSDHQ